LTAWALRKGLNLVPGFNLALSLSQYSLSLMFAFTLVNRGMWSETPLSFLSVEPRMPLTICASLLTRSWASTRTCESLTQPGECAWMISAW